MEKKLVNDWADESVQPVFSDEYQNFYSLRILFSEMKGRKALVSMYNYST